LPDLAAFGNLNIWNWNSQKQSAKVNPFAPVDFLEKERIQVKLADSYVPDLPLLSPMPNSPSVNNNLIAIKFSSPIYEN
jgi:hypothetical protein